ncbi:MFS transporter [Aquipuribacter hungaricus]|uniref:MFS transporter n=1 Tax=Aquipuribacter hungaricus TaxID=545624 RepID=UPI0030EEDF01
MLRQGAYRRLLAVRVSSQVGDGAFQAGLASYILFSPTETATAPLVAGALSATVLPFTLVGPFAGVLLDRWSRQRVLLLSNLVRVVLAAAVAALVLASGGEFGGGLLVGLYALVLAALTVNRFILAGLGAALPKTVDRSLLVTANAITPTVGTGAFGAGFGLGFGIRFLLGAGPATDATVIATAAVLFGTSSVLALRIGRGALGPDERTGASAAQALRAVVQGLREGASHVWHRPGPRDAIGVIGAHRFAYGLSVIATFLLARGYLADDAQSGLGVLALAGGAAAGGALLAAVLTPSAVPRLERWRAGRPGPRLAGLDRWVVLALLVACAVEMLYTLGVAVWSLTAGAFVLGLAGQVVKIAADTHVQRGVDESFRGRAFSLYDVVFNAAFILAAALGALVVPDDGYSRPLYAFIALLYLVVAVLYLRACRRAARHGVAAVPTAG